MKQSLVLLVVRRFEPNRKPSCWWRGRVMALGAEPAGGGGGSSGLAMVGSNYWIIIDPSWGSKCSSGAQQAVGANVAASCGYCSLAQSFRFLFLQQRGATNGCQEHQLERRPIGSRRSQTAGEPRQRQVAGVQGAQETLPISHYYAPS